MADKAPRTPPSTNDSPIKGPTKIGKQPAKNLTNSDPPLPKVKGKQDGGSDLSGKGNKPTTADPSRAPKGAVVSRPELQYVPSSTTITRYINGDIILPSTLDEAELYDRIGIFDEMLLDPTIAGVRLWTNVNVLADGFNLEAAEFEPDLGQEQVNPVDATEADWARRYVKACYKRLKYIDRDIYHCLWDLLDGARIPHKLAEATFDTIAYGDYAGQPGFLCLKTKPRLNYNLVYDSFNTFRGIVAVVPGGSLAKWSGFIFDVSVLPNAVAAEKLVMFMADDRDGLPRSLYNAAYGPWKRMLDLYVDFMDTSKASAAGKVSLELGDKAAQSFTDPDTGEEINAEQAANNALAKFGNNGTLVHMNGSKVIVWYPPANALNTFIEGIKMCKVEICTALTTNSKAILEGEHGSGLSEDNAQDDAQPVIEMLKTKLCLSLDRLSYNLLKLAKGEEYAMRYCPSASMKRGDIIDFAPSATAYAAVMAAEGFTPSQIPEVMKLIGVKQPNAAEMEVLGSTWLAGQKMKAQPPQPPEPVAPGTPKPAPPKQKP